MDPILVPSLLTVLCFAVFIGIVIWAYSARNRSRFDEAARLPFADEARSANRGHGDE